MKKKLLSIIVPVYNAEKYIEKCVESLLGQTYECVEVILVNDGSRDGSLSLCRTLAERDGRIKVHDKPNGGAASARNLGLKHATGEYIGFCDADDFFDPDAFETLIGILEENNLPTVECLSRVMTPSLDVIAEDSSSRELRVIDSDEAIREIFLRRGNVSLAVRVTRAEYIKDICIPEGRRVEDFYFTVLLLLRTGKTAVYSYPFYNCIISDGSVTRGGGGSIYFDAIYFFDKARELLGEKNESFALEQQYYLYKMYYLLAISLNSGERRKFSGEIKRIKKEIRKGKRLINGNPHLAKKEKSVLKIARVSFWLARTLYLLKNKIRRKSSR